jgi:hypothetical protein
MSNGAGWPVMLAAFLLLPRFGQSAAAIATEDFEVGDLSAWVEANQTNGTVSVSHDFPHSGVYSVKHVLNGSVNTLMRMDFSSTAVVYGRVYFYLDPAITIPGSLQILQLLNSGPWAGRRLFLQNASGLHLALEGLRASGPTVITPGAWHSVGMQYDPAAGAVRVYLDGATTPEVAALGLSLSPANVLMLGCWGTATGTIFFDDLEIGTTPAGSPSVSISMRHPNSFGRTALPLLSTFWGWTNTDQLTTEIDKIEVYRQKGLTSGREVHSIDLSKLKPGVHTLTTKLLGAGGTVKAEASDTIRKWVNGAPLVSIDANNSLSLNGKLIFPVTPFLQTTADWSTYRNNGWANMYGWASSWAPRYSAFQYQQFIDTIGKPSIGPDGGFCNAAAGFCINQPNAVSAASAYVQLLKNDSNVLMWTWCDEPDSGGNTPRILPATIGALTDALHDIDPNHPQALNLYGYAPGGTRKKGFLYPSLVADVYSFDYYPMIYRQTIASWTAVLDQFQSYTFGLTPWFTFVEAGIEPCKDPPLCTGGHGPTAEQLRMEAWLAVIHGVKGVSWWGPEDGSWTYIDPAHHVQMAAFVDQIGRLKDVVLSPVPSRSVTTDANTPGNRVDSMVREDANNVWVFAARVTEIGELNMLTSWFTVSGLPRLANVTVFDENRTLSAASGVFSDSFAPNAVHIYKIPKTASAPPRRSSIGR